MLKTVLYILLFITTAFRFLNMSYLLLTGSTDLPLPVLLTAAAMVIYGVVLLVKKHVGMIRLKEFMAFYMVQTVLIAFNLIFMTIFSPLEVSLADALLLGTFLDILINCGALHFCVKEMRNAYATTVYSAVTSHAEL